MSALRSTFLLVTCLFLASGCAISSRCRITVGNASENMDRDIPKSLLVSWKTKENKSVSRKVTLKGNIPQSFRGRIYFQIGTNETVKPFIMPDTNDTSADMPWAKPESWEGIPGIPGLTTQ